MKQLQIGIIGAGGIADRRVIPAILHSDRIKLAAIMDINPTVAQELQKKYGVPSYTDIAALLQDPSVEAIYIATPVFCHREQVMAAANAGKHILCEKPFSLTAAEAKEMVLFCRERNVHLCAGFMMRFHDLHEKMRKIVQSGRLGKLVHVSANFSCWYPQNNSWRQKKESGGGGALMDMGVHCLDLISYITKEKLKNISAIIRTRAFQYEVDDSSSLLAELEHGGSCSINSFFCIPDEAALSRLEIYGTHGRLTAEGTLGQTQEGTLSGVLTAETGIQKILLQGDQSRNMYEQEFLHFFDCLAGMGGSNTTGDEMVSIQRLVEEAYEASALGTVAEGGER